MAKQTLTGYTSASQVKTQLDKVTDLELKVDGGSRQVTISYNDGTYGYVRYPDGNNGGAVSVYHISDKFDIYKNETIEVTPSIGLAKVVSVISKVKTDGSYVALVSGNSTNKVSWTADEDCSIVLSSMIADTNLDVSVTSKSIDERTSELESSVLSINGRIQLDKYKMISISENPLAEIRREAGLTSAIRSWGFIGDSLASGEIWGDPVQSGTRFMEDDYSISWGQFLCRLCGSTGYNYSVGGGEARTFVNDNGPFDGINRGLNKLLNDEQKQVYIIAFGQNDESYVNATEAAKSGNIRYYDSLGSESDCVSSDSPTTHGNTFVGYYSEIIVRIKNKYPDSLIMLVTNPFNNVDRSSTSNLVKMMQQHYSSLYPNSVYLIDLAEYAMDLFDDFQLNGIHLNSQGYLYASYVFATYIDWILRKNMVALIRLPLIGKV